MSINRGLPFDHVDRMSDDRGLFEHALGTERRIEHGYCTDDNARLLLVTTRESDVGAASRLSRLALEFLLDAQADDGRFHNRLDSSHRWTDQPSVEDCWGRALWALGTTAVQHADTDVRFEARVAFELSVALRSRWPRAMAFAALGAAAVVEATPDHPAARALLADTIHTIGPCLSDSWRWPEPRLTYANASMAEALIATGDALDDDATLDQGLVMDKHVERNNSRPGLGR